MTREKIGAVIISYIKTFLATFLSVLGVLIVQLPNEVLLTPDAWKTGAISGLIVGLVRSALSESWKKTPFIPKELGGNKKS